MALKKMTQNELVEFLSTLSECTMAITYSSPLKMNKGGIKGVPRNPLLDKDVRKAVTSQYLFGKNYTEIVNESLKENNVEGEFKSGSLPWGEWKMVDKVITYKDNLYLRCYIKDDAASTFTYFVDGCYATEDELDTINMYLPSSGSSKKQSEAGLEKENQVRPINIMFSNIESIEIEDLSLIITLV